MLRAGAESPYLPPRRESPASFETGLQGEMSYTKWLSIFSRVRQKSRQSRSEEQ